MTAEVVASEVRQMFGSIAKRYDLTNSVMSFGIHHWWRYRMLKLAPRQTDLTVLDLCTGTADLIPPLAKRYARVVGADFCLPMLRAGLPKVRNDSRASRALLIQADALGLAIKDASVDLVTVAFGVRNFADRTAGLSEILRVLKPGGTLLVLEFGQPTLAIWRQLFSFYSKYLMPLIGACLTGNRSAYTYLPETAASFPCGARFEQLLSQVGFLSQRSFSLCGGVAYLYEARRAIQR